MLLITNSLLLFYSKAALIAKATSYARFTGTALPIILYATSVFS